ncbi:MAG: peptidoglycan-binding protein [Pseudomonadota bacterium]|nr:peptidoglycan-binding protein [Pseudomonadota bacterium]
MAPPIRKPVNLVARPNMGTLTMDADVLKLTAPTQVVDLRMDATLLSVVRQALLVPVPMEVGATVDAIRTMQAQSGLVPNGLLAYDDVLVLLSRMPPGAMELSAALALASSVDPDLAPPAAEWPSFDEESPAMPAIELLQERLVDRGAAIEVDGEYGPATRDAVRAFQTAAHLEVDGMVGPKTWAALMEGVPVLGPGTSGAIVRVLQRLLDALGVATLTGTGNFADRTKAAVLSFQTEYSRPVTGTVSLDDWRVLVLASATNAAPAEGLGAEETDLRARFEAAIPQVPPAEAPRIRRVVDAAIASLGIREKPVGSNRGVEVDQLVGTRALPWCALAVSAWLKTGLGATSWAETPFGQEFAAVEQIRAWGNARGCIAPAEGRVAQPGSILVMRRDGLVTPPGVAFTKGHTGLVLCDEGAGVRLIEGNSGDGVRHTVRPKSELVGFVRWWAAA